MLGLRFSLFSKIMLWFFLNLIVLAVLFFVIFRFNIGFEQGSPFYGTSNRIDRVSRLLEGAVDEKSREERDQILQRYTEAYAVDFYLFDSSGNQLGGKPVNLPESVYQDITQFEGFGPRPESANNSNTPRRGPGGLGPPGSPAVVSFTTTDPTTYWKVIRILSFNQNEDEPVRTRIIIKTDSPYGYGLFFDPWPWVIVTAIIILVSILMWLPFVRHITNSLRQMTRAAKKISREDFSVRVDAAQRTDELGLLGTSINNLAERLSGFVHGQKRFLGDISHELNSPLARMQFALSILEDRVRAENQPHVADVKEEVEHMSKLVAELLSYSKSGIRGTAVSLEPIKLRPLVEKVVERETIAEPDRKVEIAVPPDIVASGQSELLFRAIANLVRNGLDHTDEKGRVGVFAESNGSHVILTVLDDGPGVPEDKIDKIFDPLFRVEADRSRATGGSGLGLAIVKTCVEACGGKVEARNISPNGLRVVLTLKKPVPA